MVGKTEGNGGVNDFTRKWIEQAKRRGENVACEVHESMGVSNGTTALGIALALGELPMPRAGQHL